MLPPSSEHNRIDRWIVDCPVTVSHLFVGDWVGSGEYRHFVNCFEEDFGIGRVGGIRFRRIVIRGIRIRGIRGGIGGGRGRRGGIRGWRGGGREGK